MVTKKITSLQHPLVLDWVRLRQNKHYREECKKVLIVGKKMVEELPIEALITLEEISDLSVKDQYVVSEAILKKITGLEQPDGLAAIAKLPEPQNLRKQPFLVILDQISDPGNLGTLLRTSLGLGWKGVILTPGTVDLFNDKALRAGKGAQFHLPYAWMSPEEIAEMNLHFYTADLEGTELDRIEFQGPRAVILSHEARGASEWSQCNAQKVTIPMHANVESLNVAMSGAMILYVMRPIK